MWWLFVPQSLAPWLVALTGLAADVGACAAALVAPPYQARLDRASGWPEACVRFDEPRDDARDAAQAKPTSWLARGAGWLADAAAVADCEARVPGFRRVCLELLAEDWAERGSSRDTQWLLYLWDRHGAAPERAVYRVIADAPDEAERRLSLGRAFATSFGARALGKDLLDLAMPGAGSAASDAWRVLRGRQRPDAGSR